MARGSRLEPWWSSHLPKVSKVKGSNTARTRRQQEKQCQDQTHKDERTMDNEPGFTGLAASLQKKMLDKKDFNRV